jgi:hypothetical protein
MSGSNANTSHQDKTSSSGSTELDSVLGLINKDDMQAMNALSTMSAANMTELVREASNWAFRLDLQERVEQVRAQELGMLDDPEV